MVKTGWTDQGQPEKREHMRMQSTAKPRGTQLSLFRPGADRAIDRGADELLNELDYELRGAPEELEAIRADYIHFCLYLYHRLIAGGRP